MQECRFWLWTAVQPSASYTTLLGMCLQDDTDAEGVLVGGWS